MVTLPLKEPGFACILHIHTFYLHIAMDDYLVLNAMKERLQIAGSLPCNSCLAPVLMRVKPIVHSDVMQ